MTVEIDESVVTKRKYNRGRVAENNQVWLTVGIAGKRVTFSWSWSRNGMLQRCTKSSCVALHRENSGYSHANVNHSENFVNPNHPQHLVIVHTQSIENLWSWIKPFLRSKGRK
uniref:ISXO2-like transposase domain-containing protein n=1 Tax=Anopheles minimus TaxID=112268 RepID=A0A182W800_9DIPT